MKKKYDVEEITPELRPLVKLIIWVIKILSIAIILYEVITWAINY